MGSYTSNTKTVGDVLSHVKRQFGDESGVQISDEDIIRWTNSGIDEIFRRSEPLKASTTANLVGGQADYTLPDNILRVQSILVNGIPVEQRSTQEIEEYILKDDPTGNTSGQPTVWAEWGGTITFYPKPSYDVTNGITLRYIKGPTPVIASSDLLPTPDAFYNRLIEYILQQAYELDENFSAADTKAAQFAQNLESYAGKDQVTANAYPTITILEEDL
jgi:hypothetical protein